MDDGDFMTIDDKVRFKHIRSGFGSISVVNILRGEIRLVEMGKGRETMFADADEFIRAGWAID